jgi:phage/plasmid-associated DNA primase
MIADPNQAFWDRWIVVKFPTRFRDTERDDKQLTAKLTTRHELSGILSFAERGLVRLQRRGYFKVPPLAAANLEEFRLRADQVQQFIADQRQVGWAFYSQPQAWRDYQTWYIETGHEGLHKSNFFERMRRVLGIPVWRGGVPGWTLERPGVKSAESK